MEDGVGKVLRARAHVFEEAARSGPRVAEVRGLAGEASTVLGIGGALAAEEIGRVGDVGDGGLDHRERVLGRGEEVRGAAAAGRVLERVSRLALGGVHADGEGGLDHARAHERHRRLHRLAPRLARELHVRGDDVGSDAERLGHDRRRGLHRVGLRLGADPHRADAPELQCRGQRRAGLRLRQHLPAWGQGDGLDLYL